VKTMAGARTFHQPVLDLYLTFSVPMQVALGTLLGGLWYWKYRATGAAPQADDWLMGSVALLSCGLILLPLAFAMAHHGRVRVDGFGVEVAGRLGLRRVVAWSAVASVEPVRIFWLRYLRILSITGRPAWLPVRVTDPEGYREAIARYAGDEHPVARALAATS